MADIDSIYCPNCHQKTSLTTRKTHDAPSLGKKIDIAECNGCDFFVMVTRNRNNNQIITISPNPLPKSVDQRIPEDIADDFREALLCLSVGANRGASVLARRAVQSICKNKGATKRDLKDQVDELFTKNIITEDLKNWAHEVRYVGNDAAHPNDTAVSKEDAEEILDLLDSLCEVLYIAPAKAANRKAIREARKNGTQ